MKVTRITVNLSRDGSTWRVTLWNSGTMIEVLKEEYASKELAEKARDALIAKYLPNREPNGRIHSGCISKVLSYDQGTGSMVAGHIVAGCRKRKRPSRGLPMAAGGRIQMTNNERNG